MLLLPPEYEVLNQSSTLKKIGELLQVASLQGSRVKALTFGIKGPKKVRADLGAARCEAELGASSAAWPE